PGPGLAPVLAAVGLARGAGDHHVGQDGIDVEARHLRHLGEGAGQPPPTRPAVLAAVDPGEGAGVEPAFLAGDESPGVDRLVRQARAPRRPALAEIVRVGDLPAPPYPPERHPE